MSRAQGFAPREHQPYLWPAALAVTVMWILIGVPRWIEPRAEWAQTCVQVGLAVGVIGFLGSWIFLSRIPWRDRLLAVFVCGLCGGTVYFLRHPSFDNWKSLAKLAPPIVLTAWLLCFLATPFLGWTVRRVGLVIVLALVWSIFPLLRWNGQDPWQIANYQSRWGLSGEERFLAENTSRGPLIASTTEKLTLQAGDWPGFRGTNRDGRLFDVLINADWQKTPPKLLWKKPIGPGWSSCAVIGKRLFTQEQIGPNEAVACYHTDTGEILWTHLTPGRIQENAGSVGPRATPTFHDGKIYALGAVGTLTCLDAASGERVWSRNVRDDAGTELPAWGFSSSPLVLEGIVTVYAGGPNNKTLLGYDAVSGKVVWSAGEGRNSYCSPHPAHVGGVQQIILSTDKGLAAYKPGTGGLLWKHDWPVDAARVVQPGIVDDGTVLIGTGFDHGTRKVNVRREGDVWHVAADWTTRAIKPYFNDFVIHHGHMYGFDQGFFTCVNLAQGKKKWRERGGGDGYGNGQVLLLGEQDLLLIVSEHGEVSLVEASPAGYRELPGRFQAIQQKTWNHPVIAHGRLFVRNSAEIACYELVGSTRLNRGR